jgi:predicted small lipoprotein YifL
VILIVKSVLDLSRVAGLSMAILLAGCGQKGPLFLPAKQPAASPAQQTTPAQSSTPGTAPASK